MEALRAFFSPHVCFILSTQAAFMDFGRSIVAVVVGVIVGAAVILFIQYLNSLAFPLPGGTDTSDPASMARAVAEMPLGAMLGLVFGYLVGTTTGAAVGARVSPSHPLVHSVLVALVFLAFGIANFRTIRHPTWVVVASVLAFAIAPFVGAKFGAPTIIHRRRSM
jgi:hypothetical protein